MSPALNPNQENYPLTVEGTAVGSLTSDGLGQGGFTIVNPQPQPGIIPSSDDQGGISNTNMDTSEQGIPHDQSEQ